MKMRSQKAEEFVQEKTEQIIEKMDMMRIDTEKFSEYPMDVLSRAFDFCDMEYFVGIKLFNRVIDKLGVNLAHQDRYELFDRIYEEEVREKKDKNYMEGIEIPPKDVSSIEIPKEEKNR